MWASTPSASPREVKSSQKPGTKPGTKVLKHWSRPSNFAPGEVAEWSIAAVLKTVEGYTSGGSNPSLSAVSLSNFSKEPVDRVLTGFLLDGGATIV